jgi:hypothetical protein
MDAGRRFLPDLNKRSLGLAEHSAGCGWHAACDYACMLIDLTSLHPENQQDAERLLAALVGESTDMSEQSPHACLSRARSETAPECLTGG